MKIAAQTQPFLEGSQSPGLINAKTQDMKKEVLNSLYRNIPKFSDRQVWANSADPDQRVYTVCDSLCIFWMHYSKETPSCSTFRWLQQIFGCPKFGDFYSNTEIAFLF